MKNKKLKIGIDLDEVIWDLIPAWLNAYNARMEYWHHSDETYIPLKPEDIKMWNMKEYVGEHASILFNLLTEDAFWSNVELKKYAYLTLEKLNQKYDVYIITSSNYHSLTAKIERVLELLPFIEPSQIIISYNKQMIDVDVLIDDKPENLVNGKYHQILMDAPHNRWFDEGNCNIERVYDWYDIEIALKEIGKG